MGTYKYDSAVFRRNGILTLSVGPDQRAEKASNVEKSNSLFPSVPQTMFPETHIIWLKLDWQTNKNVHHLVTSENTMCYILTYGLILDISILEPLGEFLTKETR